MQLWGRLRQVSRDSRPPNSPEFVAFHLICTKTSGGMATLIFQRAGWSLQISRSSRTFAVSFTTALPHRPKPRHLAANASEGTGSTRHRSSHTSRHSSRRPQHESARSIFTSTKVYQEQQARAQTSSPVPTTSVRSTFSPQQHPHSLQLTKPSAPHQNNLPRPSRTSQRVSSTNPSSSTKMSAK